MEYLSRNDLERIANRVLREYWMLPEAQTTFQRVQPEVFVTCLLGLRIDYRHLSPDRNTQGTTSYGDLEVGVYDRADEEYYLLDGNTILIEEDLLVPEMAGRRHFSIAHEGCHHVLNRTFPGSYSGGENVSRALNYCTKPARNGPPDWEEWQANNMASMILMPRGLLFRDMRLCGINGPIPILNRLGRVEDFKKFSRLAEMLGVSQQALAIRMKQYGLIGKDYLQNPYEILNIEYEEYENGRMQN